MAHAAVDAIVRVARGGHHKFRGVWHLFGHSHGNLGSFMRSSDVGVDFWGFRPAGFEKIRERMDAVTEEFSED